MLKYFSLLSFTTFQFHIKHIIFFVILILVILIALPQLYTASKFGVDMIDCQPIIENSITYPEDLAQYQFNQTKIPKKIHHIYFGWKKDSEAALKRIREIEQTWINRNPGYESKTWNAVEARQLIETEFEWFLETYDSYSSPIQKIDAFRYFLLYHHGGVYSDLDVSCHHNLDSLLVFDVVVPVTDPIGLSNDFMMAAPHHPFILRVLQNLKDYKNFFMVPYLTVLMSTGSLFLTLNYCEYPYKEKIVLVGDKIYTGAEGWTRHSTGKSWHSWDVTVAKYVFSHRWIFSGAFFGFILLIWLSCKIKKFTMQNIKPFQCLMSSFTKPFFFVFVFLFIFSISSLFD